MDFSAHHILWLACVQAPVAGNPYDCPMSGHREDGIALGVSCDLSSVQLEVQDTQSRYGMTHLELVPRGVFKNK